MAVAEPWREYSRKIRVRRRVFRIIIVAFLCVNVILGVGVARRSGVWGKVYKPNLQKAIVNGFRVIDAKEVEFSNDFKNKKPVNSQASFSSKLVVQKEDKKSDLPGKKAVSFSFLHANGGVGYGSNKRVNFTTVAFKIPKQEDRKHTIFKSSVNGFDIGLGRNVSFYMSFVPNIRRKVSIKDEVVSSYSGGLLAYNQERLLKITLNGINPKESRDANLVYRVLPMGPLPQEDVVVREKAVLAADSSAILSSLRKKSSVKTTKETKWKEYRVKKGDTVIFIAKRFGVSSASIIKANRLKDPDNLKVNQTLLIPLKEDYVNDVIKEIIRRAKLEEEERKNAPPVKVSYYKVKKGDTLWSIAARFDLEIDTIIGCNSFKNPNYIKPGTKIRIPNQDGIFYKVRKKDTLSKIAKKYKVPVEAIISANSLSSRTLRVGQEIFIPGAKPVVKYSSHSYSTYSARSGFMWPVRGRITSRFGWRRDPFRRYRRRFHSGIDIRARVGYPIRAAKSGRVIYAGWMGGYGRVVVIDHGRGWTTLYAHCYRIYVRRRQWVRKGQRIASVGRSGRTTGSHLHFEIRRYNNPVNPLRFLR